MKKICMVVPYFGKLPQSFNFFLLSCAYNPDVDWLLLTDDDRPLPYPENVHCVVMSFDALRARFQTKFSFPLSLERPYKLRDYRPAYGFLLEEELRGYDFWGCCDVDMMFGDIGVFITGDMLSRYDQIGRMGHFSLYRNTPEMGEDALFHGAGQPFQGVDHGGKEVAGVGQATAAGGRFGRAILESVDGAAIVHLHPAATPTPALCPVALVFLNAQALHDATQLLLEVLGGAAVLLPQFAPSFGSSRRSPSGYSCRSGTPQTSERLLFIKTGTLAS